MQVRYKVWLEEGEHVFGDGLFSLLREIDRLGSINRAAQSLHMSYRQAWGRVKKAEERLGIDLLVTRTGGEDGGGAELTKEGRELMEKYNLFRREVDKAIKACYQAYFG
ncbi:MAG: molybdate transport system regulatory protein [Clostridia bacterium]|nr:molybdate transport system regulatory protein [Clostridia bacterium]